MKISTRKITWTTVSCVFALLTGAPAIADDTELLLLNPNPADQPKPNVMFILDSSGSMGNPVMTTEPFDSTLTYPVPATNGCDPNRLYWTDVDVLPVCDAGNDRYFEKSVYHCDYSTRQLAGLGSFTDTMVMLRGGDPADTSGLTWNDFAPGYHDSPVECEDDLGEHGDGTGIDEFYPTAGTNLDLTAAFTDDPDQTISWGSPPRNISYTVYDGNYLNWKAQPATVSLSKTNIMKTVTKKVLSSVDNLNVGLMRFNGGNGGPVILDITDLDANRQDVLDAVDLIPAGGTTPLSETVYESALFWRGLPAKYGTTAAAPALTDANAMVAAGATPEIYEQPDWDACAKNYNIVLSDGEPRSDYDVADLNLLVNLPNSGTVLGYTGCDGTVLVEGGQCMDDIAQYLATDDIDPLTPGEQYVVTHTIGFDINLPILAETAQDSGGQYFLADNVESLTKTLLSIVANINDQSLSFTAPAVSVNTFNRTRNLNDLYITTFGAKSRAHWPGNLKKYKIQVDTIIDAADQPAVDPLTGFFDKDARSYWTTSVNDGNNVLLGGAAQQLPGPVGRNLFTNNGTSDLTDTINHVSVGNMGNFLDAEFGLTGAPGEPTKENLILWARGADLLDEDNNTSTLTRTSMGDPLHSQPAAIVYGGTEDNPEVVVYTATNDGYLHAIDGATGEELWAFIPKQLLANLTRLYFDPRSKYKQYGIDGNIIPVVKDVDADGEIESGDGDRVYIVFGMRRGGDTYFALDVTDKTAPELLWDVSLPEFGESWSSPVVTRIDIGGSVSQNADKAVIVIGGGYDTTHDTSAHPANPDGVGAGVHFLDLLSGDRLWRAGEDSGAELRLDETNREMYRAIPNEIRVIDLTGDGFANRMYATDLGGQIWRFDIFNGEEPANLVTGGVIARLGAEGLGSPGAADTRRFYNAPDVALITDKYQQRRFLSINVGSGYRAHPFDLTAADRFFSVRDPDVFSQLTQIEYDNYDIATDDELVEVSGQTQTVITASDRGWKFTLPDDQKVLADSLTFDNEVFFVAFSPNSTAAASCSAGKGTNYLYRMSAINGDPIVPNLGALDPLLSDNERRETLQQGGIAPSPTILFPSPEEDCSTEEECNPPPLFCVGVECKKPGFDNVPVRTLWTQDGIE